jgi:hypothetical protein
MAPAALPGNKIFRRSFMKRVFAIGLFVFASAAVVHTPKAFAGYQSEDEIERELAKEEAKETAAPVVFNAHEVVMETSAPKVSYNDKDDKALEESVNAVLGEE